MRREAAFILLSVFFCQGLVFGQKGLPDNLLEKLNMEIKKSKVYDSEKKSRISNLKEKLKQAQNTDARFAIIYSLCEEYGHYNFDSAYRYSKILETESLLKNDRTLIASAKLKTTLALVFAGMFQETFDSFDRISIANVADSVKAEYYALKASTYFLLNEYNNYSGPSSATYDSIINAGLDSALFFLQTNSFQYNYHLAMRLVRKDLSDSALSILTRLNKRSDLTHSQMALVANGFAVIWRWIKKDLDKALPYLIEAAIADIRAVDKDNWSLYNVASVIYKKGDVENAVNYIDKASKDASFYNSRLWKVQIATILPLIEGEMMNNINNQKKKLQVSLLIISLLAVFLAWLAFIIRKQVKKLSIAKQNLSVANEKQKLINEELLKVNALKEKYNSELEVINWQLSEANKIKEEYIGQYFNLATVFIARIEKAIALIEKKVTDRKWEEAGFVIKTIDLKKEKDELLNDFDKIFLKLFPNFVDQFNSLFNEEDKIVLKDDQILNTDLRIFAFIRLGVTQNERIADILDYSIHTIYSKKTKIRSKTIINRETFEQKLIEITTLQL